MKWICTVCKYVHEGDEPPDICPVCKQPKEKFEPLDEAGETDAAASGENAVNTASSGKATEPKAVRTWYCTVCKYVHEGDSPPDTCPVCKKPWSAFIPNVEGPDGPRLPKAKPKSAAATKPKAGKANRYRCVICNYIHDGNDPPTVCPICGAGKDAFVPELDSPEHHHHGFAGFIERLHLHPVSAHFPNGALPLAFLAWIIYLVLGDGCFERASFYLMLVAATAIPFTALSGWSDAKHRFKTTTTGVFPEKKRWSWVLSSLSAIMVIWRLILGWSHVPAGTEMIIYTGLLVVATVVAARLGMLGGKLVFGH